MALCARRSRHRNTPCLWLPWFLRAFSPRGVPSGGDAPRRHRPILVNPMYLLRRECGRGRIYCNNVLCSPDTERLAGGLRTELTLSRTDCKLVSQPCLVIRTPLSCLETVGAVSHAGFESAFLGPIYHQNRDSYLEKVLASKVKCVCYRGFKTLFLSFKGLY